MHGHAAAVNGERRKVLDVDVAGNGRVVFDVEPYERRVRPRRITARG